MKCIICGRHVESEVCEQCAESGRKAYRTKKSMIDRNQARLEVVTC